ncbi:hypothetical protein DEDE109153_07040 [Deinococcus deserti]
MISSLYRLIALPQERATSPGAGRRAEVQP